MAHWRRKCVVNIGTKHSGYEQLAVNKREKPTRTSGILTINIDLCWLSNVWLGDVHRRKRSLMVLDMWEIESSRRSCEGIRKWNVRMYKPKRHLLELWSRARGLIGRSEVMVAGGIETSKIIRDKVRMSWILIVGWRICGPMWRHRARKRDMKSSG